MNLVNLPKEFSYSQYSELTPREGTIIICVIPYEEGENKGKLIPVEYISFEDFSKRLEEIIKNPPTVFEERYSTEPLEDHSKRMERKLFSDILIEYHPQGEVVAFKTLSVFQRD